MKLAREGISGRIVMILVILGAVTAWLSGATLTSSAPRATREERIDPVPVVFVTEQPPYFKTQDIIELGHMLEGSLTLFDVYEVSTYSARMFVMTEDQFIAWDSRGGQPQKSLYDSGLDFVYYGKNRTYVLPIHLLINSTQKYYFILYANLRSKTPELALTELYTQELTGSDLPPLTSSALGAVSAISLATAAFVEKTRRRR